MNVNEIQFESSKKQPSTFAGTKCTLNVIHNDVKNTMQYTTNFGFHKPYFLDSALVTFIGEEV